MIYKADSWWTDLKFNAEQLDSDCFLCGFEPLLILLYKSIVI